MQQLDYLSKGRITYSSNFSIPELLSVVKFIAVAIDLPKEKKLEITLMKNNAKNSSTFTVNVIDESKLPIPFEEKIVSTQKDVWAVYLKQGLTAKKREEATVGVMTQQSSAIFSTIISYKGCDIKELLYRILAIFPTFIPIEHSKKELSNYKKELSKISVGEEISIQKITQIIDVILENTGWEEAFIDKILTPLNEKLYSVDISSYDTELRQLRLDTNAMEEALQAKYRQMSNLNMYIVQLSTNQSALEDRVKSVQMYFKANKTIKLLGIYSELQHNELYSDTITKQNYRVDSDAIVFTVEQDLCLFRKKLAKKLIETKGSYIYVGANSKYYKNMLEDIFINNTVKLHLYAYGALTFNERSITLPYGGQGYIQPDEKMTLGNRILNPHVGIYHCAGGNGTLIRQALAENDIEGALTQYSSAVANLNLEDNVCVSCLMRILTESKVRCLTYKGVDYNYKELMKQYKEEDNTKDTDENAEKGE